MYQCIHVCCYILLKAHNGGCNQGSDSYIYVSPAVETKCSGIDALVYIESCSDLVHVCFLAGLKNGTF
jgi:hypothetical protein